MKYYETKLNEFYNTKKLEGCSEKTLNYYRFNLNKFFEWIEKSPEEITSMDIRNFLSYYKQERKVTNITLDNMRRVYQSFFTWMHREGFISKNPSNAVQKIKSDKVIKTAFSEEELEILRDGCKNLRESAIIELLFSTGMRVGELEKLNIKDIDFNEGTIVVFGKGRKERVVYFNTKAKLVLQKYLKTRTDDNEALFVGFISPHNRLKISTYELCLRELGKRCGIHCHPHRFRRTCTTTLLNRGMAIQEVSKILGHTKLETTMIYYDIPQTLIKNNYKKYMS